KQRIIKLTKLKTERLKKLVTSNDIFESMTKSLITLTTSRQANVIKIMEICPYTFPNFFAKELGVVL
ncbi:hypothetical protein ABTN34_17585, partial [Acinetobacter baumannii]